MHTEIMGVVLAGGLSSRLGQTKHVLQMHGDHVPDMLRRTVTLLESRVACVRVSCRKESAIEGYACIPDRGESMGPLSGLYAALHLVQTLPYRALLMLSCDLPFMNAETLDSLLWHRDEDVRHNPDLLMTTFRQTHTGYIEALVAIYEKRSFPFFAKAVTLRQRQINLVLPEDSCAYIPYPPKESLPFFNINTPDDLAVARKIMKDFSGE